MNTIFVFILSGLWHGADYTFILWGILNGLFVIIDRMFEKTEKKIFEPVRWALTFCTINVLWLLFRADSIVQWKSIIKTVIMMQNTTISSGLISCFQLQEMPFLTSLLHIERSVAIRGFWLYVYAAAALFISLVPENNYRKKNQLSYWSLIPSAVLFVWAFICLSSESVFVYFNF